ncbi:MAG: hypothetical protein V3R94_06495 [Acidobacteriota bacterium]
MECKKIFIAGMMVAGLLGCGRGGYDFVPDPVVGVWETSHEKYADRIFELKFDQIVFDTGGGTFARHSVVNVQEVQEDGEALYTVFYAEPDGHESQFAFYYHSTLDTIRFKNQKRIEWTRRSDG